MASWSRLIGVTTHAAGRFITLVASVAPPAPTSMMERSARIMREQAERRRRQRLEIGERLRCAA